MSRSMIPLQRWRAPGRWPRRHSSSSRTSMIWMASPNVCMRSTSRIVTSRMRERASSTRRRKPGECSMISCVPSGPTGDEPMAVAHHLATESGKDRGELGAHLLRRERGEQRGLEVALEELGLVRGVPLDDLARARGRLGTREVHDEDRAAGPDEAGRLAPENERIGEVVEE